MALEAFQLVSAALFCIGVYGVLARRSAVLILMSIELMLNAVNINLIAAAAHLDHSAYTGQIIAIFVITVAAAEVGIRAGHNITALPQQVDGKRGRSGPHEMVI